MRAARRPRRPVHRAVAVAAAIGVAVVVTPATPTTADHQAPAGFATLVGNLQSELGCAGDWQPDCGATRMAATTGKSSAVTVDVPAGTWEWKVALDGTWDRSYPAANVLLELAGDATLTFSYDDATHSVTVASAEPVSGVTAADRAMAGTSLRDDLTRERFYFVMTDRFENADPGNDAGGIAGDRTVNGLDPAAKGFYHGGDIAGLREQLDYIAGLGTTAIWLTPSFVNRPVQGQGTNMSAGYHGYWITDFTQIDPHLGTNEELAALIDEAHARGIKVFFDIITNHTADVIAYDEDDYTLHRQGDEPYKDADGNAFDDRDYVGTGTFPPLDPAISFPYPPVFADRPTRRSRCRPGSTTRSTTTTAATPTSPARTASTATSSASTTCSPSTPTSSPG